VRLKTWRARVSRSPDFEFASLSAILQPSGSGQNLSTTLKLMPKLTLSGSEDVPPREILAYLVKLKQKAVPLAQIPEDLLTALPCLVEGSILISVKIANAALMTAGTATFKTVAEVLLKAVYDDPEYTLNSIWKKMS
jgi:hypothetical protein